MKKFLLAGVAALTFLPTIAKAESEYKLLCVEDRIWIYSEFYQFRTEQLQHKVLKIKDTTEINGKIYHNCYAYDYDNPASSLCLVAYLGEEDGKVYMLEKESSKNPLFITYGSENIETLIYDFSINEGDIFQVGENEYYNSIDDNSIVSVRYPVLFYECTDNGRIKCISTENISQSKYYSDAKQLNLEFVTPNEDSIQYSGYEMFCKNQHFSIREGIGMLSDTGNDNRIVGYMPFPYVCKICACPPILIDLLYVCDDGDFSNVIYRQEGLPVTPERYFATLTVDEIQTDEDVIPMYFNIQGMPVSNPAEGEIYIVRRGSKATKEVYRR